jgi:hypothetical protein
MAEKIQEVAQHLRASGLGAMAAAVAMEHGQGRSPKEIAQWLNEAARDPGWSPEHRMTLRAAALVLKHPIPRRGGSR